MDFTQAAMMLGVKESATINEARKAYLARARLLHPDRVAGGSPEDIQAANHAMSQINQAWEVFQKGPSVATAQGAGSHEQPAQNFGFPVWHDASTACDICGWGPARPVSLNSVTGLIIFWRWFSFRATVCRDCGMSMYNETQRSTLLKGWWGVIAPAATVVAFLGNLARIGAIKKLPKPQGRYPGAYTLSPLPLHSSVSWWKRPASLIATAVALFIIFIFASAALTPKNSTGVGTPSGVTSSTPPASGYAGNSGMINSCWEDVDSTNLKQVDCSSPTTTWKVTREVPFSSGPASCQSDYMAQGTQWYLCLTHV